MPARRDIPIRCAKRSSWCHAFCCVCRAPCELRIALIMVSHTCAIVNRGSALGAEGEMKKGRFRMTKSAQSREETPELAQARNFRPREALLYPNKPCNNKSHGRTKL